ncbi:MAG TPA: M28 family peptidase [Thermoanaerobaculia bacterium]|nr:M28 family peptidase [Thermoanaerobaculia bacterium]
MGGSLNRIARSIVRVALAVALCIVAGLAGLAVALRQPTLRALEYSGLSRSDPRLLREHVNFLATTVRPRSAAHPENLDRAAVYIGAHFGAAGGRVSEQPFEARGRTYRNVIAEFGPRDLAAPLLVLGAHYDAFSEKGSLPGADDNASGTAGLLDLARLLGKSHPRTPVMLVAFTTEEPPFFGSDDMGSAVHAASLAAAHRAIRGMICLEMIGYYSGQQAWPAALFGLFYPDRGNFIGVAGGWQDRRLARFVKNAIRGAGGIPVYSFSGLRETSDASDQRNYWSRGWSAVMVTDTAYMRNPNYHTVRDTAETLDYERMGLVMDGVLNAVLHHDD